MDINKGENSQFFGEITIKASPSICTCMQCMEVNSGSGVVTRVVRGEETGIYLFAGALECGETGVD